MSEAQPDLPELSRHTIEVEIERMIAVLDWLDDEPDLEPQGDEEPGEDGEPILGWTDMQARNGRAYGPYTDCDADGCELDEADWEPELGSLERVSQTGWALGRDGEPSLGSTSSLCQVFWAVGSNDDREEDCEDEGAQCEDEGW